jgi:hypothetical protein
VPSFRVFFLNDANRVVASDDFEAVTDAEATRMAVLLTGACLDHCVGYELWRVAGRTAPIFGAIVTKIAANMNETTRNALLQRAERLRRSRSSMTMMHQLTVPDSK